MNRSALNKTSCVLPYVLEMNEDVGSNSNQ